MKWGLLKAAECRRPPRQGLPRRIKCADAQLAVRGRRTGADPGPPHPANHQRSTSMRCLGIASCLLFLPRMKSSGHSGFIESPQECLPTQLQTQPIRLSKQAERSRSFPFTDSKGSRDHHLKGSFGFPNPALTATPCQDGLARQFKGLSQGLVLVNGPHLVATVKNGLKKCTAAAMAAAEPGK